MLCGVSDLRFLSTLRDDDVQPKKNSDLMRPIGYG